MTQSLVTSLGVVIFLVGLYLFRAIFPALGLALGYLVASTFLEFFWIYRKSPILSSIVRPAINFLTSAAMALSFYILFYLPVEFILTEVWLKTPKVPPLIGTIALVALAIVFTFVDWGKRIQKKSSWALLFLFVFVCGLVYLVYREEKLEREYLPKVYKVSPNWVIQGQIIKIEGLNFGPPFRKGMVVVGNEQMMIIKSWEEKLVVVEQPVPAKFRYDRLRIIRSDNVSSNEVPFEIRDPDSLKITPEPK